jgi:hypothetical protein
MRSSRRLRQKFVLIVCAAVAALALGAVGKFAGIDKVTLSGIAGAALGLFVALGAPYAFGMFRDQNDMEASPQSHATMRSANAPFIVAAMSEAVEISDLSALGEADEALSETSHAVMQTQWANGLLIPCGSLSGYRVLSRDMDTLPRLSFAETSVLKSFPHEDLVAANMLVHSWDAHVEKSLEAGNMHEANTPIKAAASQPPWRPALGRFVIPEQAPQLQTA